MSVYHESVGRVINGANCKDSPEVSTFFTPEDIRDHMPICTSLDDDVTHLGAFYQEFGADLMVRPVSAARFEIIPKVMENHQGRSILFKLQPFVHCGDKVRLNDEERELGDDDWSVDGVKTLSWGKVTMTFDSPAKVWWPFRGFNSYAADHTYGNLESARLIAEMELGEVNEPRCVSVDIAGD